MHTPNFAGIVRFGSGAYPPQNLRQIKQKDGSRTQGGEVNPHDHAVTSRLIGTFWEAIYPPWVGQAERLACHERQPTQFRAEARTHFICRERKCCGAFTHQEKKSRRAAPVPPCVRRLDTGHRWSQQTRMSPLRGPCRRRTRPENGCPKGCHIFHFSAGFFLSEHDSSALGYGCFAGTRGVRF